MTEYDEELPGEIGSEQAEADTLEAADAKSEYLPETTASVMKNLGGMYRSWFLDYASYVILERAVPHIEDGLKPVQRRVLYAMHVLGPERMTKVAKIVGATMAYHPHGDASINDALVQLGQKGYLIDMQGNWGNIFTGDSAAAGRYIEARLSLFAQEVLFDDKITDWKRTYDGSADEPVALPVKFPLLLLQGAEGIAVGLSSKILPHNFCEIIEAACHYLRGEDFELYPDFPTGGLVDVSGYADGRRGGRVKSRARIGKIDNRTLSISELPAGKTTSSLIDSILKANERGKIKIKQVVDMTASEVDIRVYLPAGVSGDKTIDALYAFTDCEVNLWPNACVIRDERPEFLSVGELLRMSVDRTRELLRMELQHRLNEHEQQYMAASLERIFIEERIYKDQAFEEAPDEPSVLVHIDRRLEPWKENLLRPVTEEDLKRLLEIRMARILRFNIPKHEAMMLELERKIDELKKNIAGIVAYTIRWYEHLAEQYGEAYPRRSQLVSWTQIEATKVVALDQKLYINREENFIGTALKESEFVCNCSDLDEFIIFFRDGRYMVSKVEEKKFVGRGEVIHIDRFERSRERTVYNVIYRDGKKSPFYIKRFNITSYVRDREYDLTQGKAGSKVVYFSVNRNAEAETVKIILKPRPRQRILVFEKDFSDILIKARTARGNLLTRAEVHKISLKEKGASTLGARQIWFDRDVMRLNYDGQGELIGSFKPEDKMLVILSPGECYLTDCSDTNHYESNVSRIEIYHPDKVWTAVYYNAEQGFVYLKRFVMEGDQRMRIQGDDESSRLLLLTDTPYPYLEARFAGADIDRPPLRIEAESFVGIKSIKAKGKRVSTYEIDKVEELEPLRQPEETSLPQDSVSSDTENTEEDEDSITDMEWRDRILGVPRLDFSEETLTEEEDK
ncbi:DNA gyrase/topoisomerase IV subunit A [Porphyromonas crevioricanis]|uniref:DNA topoisomerase IV subunit A n=1 Tax=Porphyromonas crevioricanis TaxID=393921 RepID=A0AB34PER5_9PORP|nr:DNA gyrase/topoisomerase IV subunit A [Porphyromonas crevioricanis]KGN93804.1 DNA topoisomerase IV subunit A [Porphyromonas crevioricanis]